MVETKSVNEINCVGICSYFDHFIFRVKKIKKEFWKTKPTSLLTEKPLVTSLSNVSSLKPPEVKSEFETKNCVQPFLGVYFFLFIRSNKKA